MKTMLILFLVLAAAVVRADAKDEMGESLEWLADTSPAIGIYTAGAPDKLDGIKDYLQFDADLKLKETLKGAPPAQLKSQPIYFIAKKYSPKNDVAEGDRFLVFLWPDAKEAMRVEYMISLSKPKAPDSRLALAYNAKFDVLADEKTILSTMRERLAAHPGMSPLPKPGQWEESAVEVPPGTPAYQALYSGSVVSMMLPADLAAPVRAKQDVAHIVEALKEYYYVMHTMPKGGNGKIIETLINSSPTKGSTVFLTLSRESVAKFNKVGKLLDPWDTPYRIDVSNPKFPWAYSCGPDKKDDGGAPGSDDIVSW